MTELSYKPIYHKTWSDNLSKIQATRLNTAYYTRTEKLEEFVHLFDTEVLEYDDSHIFIYTNTTKVEEGYLIQEKAK